MNWYPVALASLLLALPTARPTASPTATAPTPEPIQPVAELQPLQVAVGDWVHEKEVGHAGSIGTAQEAAARSKAAWIHKGHHLYVLYKSRRADGDYEGRGIVGWDAAVRRYRLDWFDSLGHAQRFSGEIDPTGALVFTAESGEGAAALKQRVSVKKQAGGKILILDEREVGSSPMAVYFESLANPLAPAPVAAKPTSAR